MSSTPCPAGRTMVLHWVGETAAEGTKLFLIATPGFYQILGDNMSCGMNLCPPWGKIEELMFTGLVLSLKPEKHLQKASHLCVSSQHGPAAITASPQTFISGLIGKLNILGNHLNHNRSNGKIAPFIIKSGNPQAMEALKLAWLRADGIKLLLPVMLTSCI